MSENTKHAENVISQKAKRDGWNILLLVVLLLILVAVAWNSYSDRVARIQAQRSAATLAEQVQAACADPESELLIGDEDICDLAQKVADEPAPPAIQLTPEPGLDGKDGERGPQGPQGIPGIPGLDGKNGLNGSDGLTPAPGLNGKDGQNGSSGKDGAPGPAGDPGPAGPAGPEGPAGPAGPEGPAGPAGPVGPEGPMGPPGAPVNCPSPSLAEVLTLDGRVVTVLTC